MNIFRSLHFSADAWFICIFFPTQISPLRKAHPEINEALLMDIPFSGGTQGSRVGLDNNRFSVIYADKHSYHASNRARGERRGSVHFSCTEQNNHVLEITQQSNYGGLTRDMERESTWGGCISTNKRVSL